MPTPRHPISPRRAARFALVAAPVLALGSAMAPAQSRDPGPAPQVFAPGVISSAANDAAISFAADGRSAYFERGNAQTLAIMVTHRTNGAWSQPVVAPFSGTWIDLEPAIAPDGRSLVFSSNRPASGGGKAIDGFYYGKPRVAKGGNLWRVDRTARGWSAPYRLPDAINSNTSLFEPSIAANGDLYYQQAVGEKGVFRLMVARRRGDGYAAPQALDLGAPTAASDMDPAIARDGSYILFASDRVNAENRLFIAFRDGAGWSAPRELGPALNGAGSVGDPRIGPEPDRLYFTSRRLAPPSGSATTDIADATRWNNGLPNIWWVRFDPNAWR